MAFAGTLESIYAIFSVVVSIVGLMVVAIATRAYARTEREELLYIAIGFTLIVATMISTTITAFLMNFQGIELILTVYYGLTTIGFLFIIYGVWE